VQPLLIVILHPFLEDDADLLLSGELAAGKTLYIPDELFGLFAPGFSLPESVCDLLYHGSLLSLNDNLLIYHYRSKPQSVPFLPKTNKA
jgi:hypothetical protein